MITCDIRAVDLDLSALITPTKAPAPRLRPSVTQIRMIMLKAAAQAGGAAAQNLQLTQTYALFTTGRGATEDNARP
jgi:hypothetical protein